MTGRQDPPAPPVILLYGPTASGKSALAIELAERIGAVIINADSLQIYAELEILTARPDSAAMARVPHRLYGVLQAAAAGSVAWWRDTALREIAAAQTSGRRVIIAGGTGLYLSTLINGLSPVPVADLAARARATALYEEIGGDAFRERLRIHDPALAEILKPGDRQRLIRAWEVWESTGTVLSTWQKMPRDPGHALRFRKIALLPPRDELYCRINTRFARMLESGALREAERFAALSLPESLPANKALGLPELRRYLAGAVTLDEAATAACQASRNYAKRQMTWFRHQMAERADPAGRDSRELVLTEFSERNLPEIISFILAEG